jgi:uracil-DNA glycosylase
MPYVHNRGDRASRIWIILERPYSSDEAKGYLLSGGMGFVLERMLKEAGLDINSCYCCSRRPNTSEEHAFAILENDLNQEQPPFVFVLGEVGQHFLPELRSKDSDKWKGQLQKNAGSLLRSPKLQYPHYMMPIYPPDRCIADWAERNVTTYIDLQKLRDEFLYWQKYGKLQELPQRKLIYGNLTLDEVCMYLERFANAGLLSIDIETVYPKKGSAFLMYPGYPITVGIADSSNFGISFNLFRDSVQESRILWRMLDKTLRDCKQILGQNFFSFDALFFEALGFNIQLGKVKDTLLRHHILWPELPHKLQFLTRQYTREPYYKDEGHGWTVKYMDKLRRYNCLDVCVTMEVYEAQEKEFEQRPHLA